MLYWNQDNFEGLARVASWAAEHQQLAGFADYCRYREQGLRRDSFRALDSFIEQVLTWTEQDQRHFVDWVCRLQYQSSRVHQLIPHQLMGRVVLPVLQCWAASAPRDATPHRWLGFVTHNPDHFRHAIAVQSDDDVSRLSLVKHLIGKVEYACHHLPEFFIGSPDEVLETAEDGAKLIAGIKEAKLRADMHERLGHAAQEVRDWIDFQAVGEGHFDDWCAERGRGYSRPRTYWYTCKRK